MKHLVGKTVTKTVEFMDDKVQIKQLSVADVLSLQEDMKDADEADSLETVSKLIRAGVVGAEEMSDEDLQGFPLGELLELSQEVMAYCGLKAETVND